MIFISISSSYFFLPYSISRRDEFLSSPPFTCLFLALVPLNHLTKFHLTFLTVVPIETWHYSSTMPTFFAIGFCFFHELHSSFIHFHLSTPQIIEKVRDTNQSFSSIIPLQMDPKHIWARNSKAHLKSHRWTRLLHTCWETYCTKNLIPLGPSNSCTLLIHGPIFSIPFLISPFSSLQEDKQDWRRQIIQS